MSPLFLVMRVLHVFLGVFWAGTLMFAAVYLLPGMREAGPASVRVLVGMQRRGYFTAMPIAALLTVVSGFWLYGNLIQTGGPAWAGSMAARVYGVGAAAGVIALLFGVFWLRPTSINIVRVADRLSAAAPGAEREELEQELTRHRMRSTSAMHWVAGLLAIATVCMALARYM